MVTFFIFLSISLSPNETHHFSGERMTVLGKRNHGESRQTDVQYDAFCRKKLHGKKLFIRHPNSRGAELVRVSEVLPPDSDETVKIELQSIDKIGDNADFDSDDELMESDPDYLLTIEQLMEQNDLALSQRDLVATSIFGHAFNNLQAMVHVR